MKELQDSAEHLQCENDSLRAQVEKRHDLGKKMCKIAAKQGTRPLAIKERISSSLTT